ncbi:MAG: type II toxin-antitoxin system RelE/ParE family toxin [Alphaproteobacteria bacterium]
MWTKPVTVVETVTFLRQADKIWPEDERLALVDFIARNPESGDLIPDTGGVRKMRWGRQGSGKRGGARVVYFYHHIEAPVYLLLAYAKAQREDMNTDEKRMVSDIAAILKRQHPPQMRTG